MNRDAIVRRFEAWLDEVLAREEPPDGIDAEILAALSESTASTPGDGSPPSSEVDDPVTPLDRPADAYQLWAAMTALAHEVKLQGRAFKELNGTLATQAERIGGELRAVYGGRERDVQREAEQRVRRQMLGALLDLRDRLGRGLESVRAVEQRAPDSRRWVARLLRAPEREIPAAVAAVTRGYELGIDHLDQMLADLNVRRIRCEGQPFDPRKMNAIDKEESGAVPEGTVLDVYRTGYEWEGDVFRPAQVKVSVAPAAHGTPLDVENRYG